MSRDSSILESVTIPMILEHFDIEFRGQRGRCPIHGGDNVTSFSFNDEVYRCFACDANGGKLSLVQQLARVGRPEAMEIVNGIAGVSTVSINSRVAGNHRKRMYRRSIAPKITKLKSEIARSLLIQDKLTGFLRDLRKNRIKNISVVQAITLQQVYEYNLEWLDGERKALKDELKQLESKKA